MSRSCGSLPQDGGRCQPYVAGVAARLRAQRVLAVRLQGGEVRPVDAQRAPERGEYSSTLTKPITHRRE